MADTSASFSVDIEETGGDDAASSLEALKEKILADSSALKEMTAAMRNLKGGTSVSIEAFQQLRDQIDAQKASIADAQAQVISMGGGFGETAEKAEELGDAGEEAGGGLDALSGAVRGMPGHFGRAAREGGRLLGVFGQLAQSPAGPYALIAVAILAVTTAALAATVAILHWAVGLADAKRNADLATEGIAASSKSLGDLAHILPGVQAATGLTTQELDKLAEGLASAGVKAKDMPDALRAIATATAGGATADFIAKLNSDLKAGKKSASELAKEVDQKFGGIVAKKMMSLDSLSSRLKAGFASIFGGLKIEGLLSGLSKIVALFEENSAVAKALKVIFEGIFQPLLDGVTAFLPKVKQAFIQAAILALKAYIALKPYSSQIAFVAKAFLLLAGVILGVIAAAFVAMLTPIAVAIAVTGGLIAAIWELVDLVVGGLTASWQVFSDGAQAAWDAVTGAIQGALDWLEGISLDDIGSNLIESLASGITGAAGAVVAAITGAVSGAISAAKSLLGIHSPSKVFAQLGGHTAVGFAKGINDNADAAGDAAGDMATGAAKAAGGAPAAASGGGGSSITINLTINVSGAGGDPEAIKEAAEEALYEALERAGVMSASEAA